MGLLSCNALGDKCFLGLNDFFLIIKALAVTICHLEEEGEEKSPEKYEIHATSLYQMTTFTKYLLWRYVSGSVCSHKPRRTSFLDFVFHDDDDDEVVGTIIKHATKKICGTASTLTLLALEDGFRR